MTEAVGGAWRVWECILCAWRFDEAVGDPDGGLPPGTRWEDVSDEWVCPECGAKKADFDMVAVG